MAEQIAPSTAYSSRFSAGAGNTGLAGSGVRFRLLDNDAVADDPVYGPSTASIIEDVTGTGEYVFTGTSPATAGKYSRAWDLGDDVLYFDDDLIVIASAASIATNPLYVTRAELKATLNIGSTYADDDIDVAVDAASRACDGYKNTRFYPTTETRYYTANPGSDYVDIDELNTLTSVTIDTAGNGSYGTTWTSGTHFTLDPINASLQGFPYRRICLRPQGGATFPRYENAVKVIGSFGWAATPTPVAQAARILAGRLLKRSRETPYGILVVSGDAVAAARLGRIDPDVAFLLDNLPGAVPLLLI